MSDDVIKAVTAHDRSATFQYMKEHVERDMANFYAAYSLQKKGSGSSVSSASAKKDATQGAPKKKQQASV